MKSCYRRMMVLKGFCSLFMLISILKQVTIIDSLGVECTESNYKFLCKNGKCILKSYHCDGDNDCGDGSDELDCAKLTCNATEQYRCTNDVCISQRWLCDGEDDCKDNSDENVTLCDKILNTNCTDAQFKCVENGECFPNSWKCDGEYDCDDHSDEQGCQVPKCSGESSFQCGGNHECILLTWKCDGEDDCPDGSDEVNCPVKSCSDDMFKCATREKCIPKLWRCDDDADCEDRSDEQNCPKKSRPCPIGYFSCSSGFPSCIMPSWKCDDQADCIDGSDELNCAAVIPQCPINHFACDSRHCILKSKVCDGREDCPDASDERRCPEKPSCDFRCKDGRCITRSKMCNHRHDCPNGEDEEKGMNMCFADECAVNNGNCSHYCINKDYGYKCGCSDGFQLNNKLGTICEDINECDYEVSPCEQVCINVKGSYKCACYAGYQMENGTRCKSITSSKENTLSLVFSDKVKIRRINFNSERFMSVLADHLQHVTGVALNIKKRMLFWTDLKDETIKSSKQTSEQAATIVGASIYRKSMNENLVGVDPKPLFSSDTVRTPVALSVDWMNDLLYWTDFSLNKISVSYSNGSWPTTIVSFNDSSPRSIAVHPEQGYMFVSLFGAETSVIARFWMNGKNRQDVITKKIEMPSGVTIDFEENRLFWLDAKLHLLSSSDFEGKARKTVLDTYNYLRNPYGIAVFSDIVYWTDRESNSLLSCHKLNGNQIKPVDARLSAPMDVQVDHPNAQPNLTQHCRYHTCQYMCLPIPKTSSSNKRYACVCPNGFVSNHENSFSCTKAQSASNSAVQGMGTGTKIAIAIFVIGGIVLVFGTLCTLFHWHQKRSLRMSMNFDNPVYRKTTTTSSEEDHTDQPVDIPRSGSRIQLIDADQCEKVHSHERRDSGGSTSIAGHLYEPMQRVATNADDTSQISFNMDDDRYLVS